MKKYIITKAILILISIHSASCSKKSNDLKGIYMQDELFFKRESQNNVKGNISASSIEKLDKKDVLIDKIIGQLKQNDLKFQFSKSIINKAGYPNWNRSIILKNANGYNTIITPIQNNNKKINLAIVSYQINDNQTKFKIINKHSKISTLPKYGDSKRQIFTQESFMGIFKTFEQNVTPSHLNEIKSTSTNEIKTKDETLVYSYCWSYSIIYPDGSITVSNTQCSNSLIIRPSFTYSLPGELQVPQPGDFGAGSTEYTNQNIIDSLSRFPCAQSVLAKIPEINNFTKETIQDIFGINEDINLTFSVGNPTSFENNTVDGYTNCNGGQTIFDCNIKLNPQMLSKASKDYIFITLIHEALHGYIKFKRHTLDSTEFKNLFPLYFPINGESQHSVMAGNQANSFVEKMAAALTTFNPNISLANAKALAWGGLGGTDQWKNLAADTLIIKSINLEAKNPSTTSNPYNFLKCD